MSKYLIIHKGQATVHANKHEAYKVKCGFGDYIVSADKGNWFIASRYVSVEDSPVFWDEIPDEQVPPEYRVLKLILLT